MTWTEILFWGSLTLFLGALLAWFLGALHIFADEHCEHLFECLGPVPGRKERKKYRCLNCGHEETL